MSFGKNFVHTAVGLAVGALLGTGVAGAAIPMPDPVARVPLVGLLPRWTWDPMRVTPPPVDPDRSPDGGAEPPWV